MTGYEDVHRHHDGSIDFDFYRRRASRRRRRVRRLIFVRILTLAKEAVHAVATSAQFATVLHRRSQLRVARGAAAALILLAAIAAAAATAQERPERSADQASEPSPETADAIFHFGIGG